VFLPFSVSSDKYQVCSVDENVLNVLDVNGNLREYEISEKDIRQISELIDENPEVEVTILTETVDDNIRVRVLDIRVLDMRVYESL